MAAAGSDGARYFSREKRRGTSIPIISIGFSAADVTGFTAW
jgi:hypothetical protein